MAEFAGAPMWVVMLCAACLVVTVFLLPSERAAAITSALLQSEQAKIVATLSALVGFGVVLATAWQIREDYAYRSEERDIRREESIARAWENLFRRAPGNTGKGAHLSLLLSEGQNVDGIDISCRAIGDWEGDVASGRCQAKPIFFDITYSAQPFDAPNRQTLKADHVEFRLFTLTNGSLFGSFDGAVFNGARIENSILSGNLSGTVFVDSDLRDTIIIETSARSFSVVRSDVSGLILDQTFSPRQHGLWQNYFWADWPPRSVSTDRITVPLAPAELERMVACRPPVDSLGAIIERDVRDALLPGTVSTICTAMAITEAAEEFSDSYQPQPTDRY